MYGRNRKVTVAGALALALIATACGSDDDDEATGDAGDTVTVTATDYAFSGDFKEIDAGTKLTLTNKSTKEVHELVALRIPDTEKRKVADIAKLSEEEQGAIFGEASPAAVLIAPPAGAPQIAAVGDGTLTEPGRYAIICAIPVGADPAAFLKAMQQATDGPPDVPGGAPHFTEGMFAEVTVK